MSLFALNLQCSSQFCFFVCATWVPFACLEIIWSYYEYVFGFGFHYATLWMLGQIINSALFINKNK